MTTPKPKTNKTAAIVFHRLDFDGICSFAVAKRYLQEEHYKVTPFPFTYGDVEPVEQLADFDLVVIVDCCLSSEAMLNLTGKNGSGIQDVIWVDHHKSSIDKSRELGFDAIPGERRTGCGACELTWLYFYRCEAPRFVRYLSAYDVFDKNRFDWEGQVLPFQYGMRSRYGLDAKKFFNDFRILWSSPGYVDGIIETGRYIYQYAIDSGARGVASYGFTVTVAGKYKAVCCLTNQFGSLPFEYRMKEEGAAICICANRISAEEYKISAYGLREENTLDLAEYMKENYRGGGHFHAAGGTLTREQFIRLITEQVM